MLKRITTIAALLFGLLGNTASAQIESRQQKIKAERARSTYSMVIGSLDRIVKASKPAGTDLEVIRDARRNLTDLEGATNFRPVDGPGIDIAVSKLQKVQELAVLSDQDRSQLQGQIRALRQLRLNIQP